MIGLVVAGAASSCSTHHMTRAGKLYSWRRSAQLVELAEGLMTGKVSLNDAHSHYVMTVPWIGRRSMKGGGLVRV